MVDSHTSPPFWSKMSGQNQGFQQRWEFRRNESDLDSSSDDHSGPNFGNEPKLKNHKRVCRLFFEENNQETVHSPQLDPEAEDRPSSGELNNEPSQSCKKHNGKSKGMTRKRKCRTQKSKTMASDSGPFDAVLTELRGYRESLIEEIKVAREDMLRWMSKEMEKSIPNDMKSPNPNEKGRARRNKVARNDLSKGRGKSGTVTEELDGGLSEKLLKGKTASDHSNEEVVEPTKDPDNVPNGTNLVASTEKQKRKRSGPSVKKQKTAAAKEQASKIAAAAAAPNYLTLPSVLPRPQVENSERHSPANRDERNFGEEKTGNAVKNLGSQMTCFPRSQQKDGAFVQIGLRNESDCEQTRGSKMANIMGNGSGNVNGSLFPFPFPRSLNSRVGIPHPNKQLGLQFLTHENRISSGLAMDGGPTRLPNGNHGFLQTYGGLDQHLRFIAQGGGMALQCPDIRGANLQPR